MVDLTQKIKEARKIAGFETQQDLANALDCTRGTIAKYESKKGSVTLVALEEISSVTGLPLAWFFHEPEAEMSNRQRIDAIRDHLDRLEISLPVASPRAGQVSRSLIPDQSFARIEKTNRDERESESSAGK